MCTSYECSQSTQDVVQSSHATPSTRGTSHTQAGQCPSQRRRSPTTATGFYTNEHTKAKKSQTTSPKKNFMFKFQFNSKMTNFIVHKIITLMEFGSLSMSVSMSVHLRGVHSFHIFWERHAGGVHPLYLPHSSQSSSGLCQRWLSPTMSTWAYTDTPRGEKKITHRANTPRQRQCQCHCHCRCPYFWEACSWYTVFFSFFSLRLGWFNLV